MDNRIILKKEFLNNWSIERVKNMTLEEYTNLDTEDSFCYWLEMKTTSVGGIGGGSSYKFGIYKRSNTSKVVDAYNRKTDGIYAWFSKYGETKESAFESIKNIIVDIIDSISKNDLSRIDIIDLGQAYKWKIAFLYSNFSIINVFRYEALKFLAENRGFNFKKKSSISELQSFLISLKPIEEDYFIYTDKLWSEYELSIKTSKPTSVTHKQLFINWLISYKLNPQIAEELESLSEEVLANGYFDKVIYDCIEYQDFYQLMFQNPIGENWDNLYEHYYYFSLENHKKATGVDLQIKYAIVTVENNAEYDSFIKNNLWEGSKKNVYDTYVNKFEKGFKLAIYKRNGNQIKIGAIGTVTNNPKTGYELNVNWNTDFEKFSVKLNSEPNNLDFYQIEPEAGKYKIEDIKNIFYKIITTNQDTMKHPLNQILYGAPGTGKTYNTKRLAIEIIDGKDYSNSERNEIIERYDQLYKSKQINFTTFHQSISYEDFIEGIKPVLKSDNEDDGDDNTKKNTIIEYEIKEGVFKNLCKLAEGVTGKVEVIDNFDFKNKDFYKMSLGGKHRLEKHNWSIKNNLIFLGWGGDKDFTHLNKIKDWKLYRDTFNKNFPDLVLETKYVIQAVYIFQKMKIGDIVIISKGNKIIDAIGIIESEYFYDDTRDIDNYQFRKVKWLATDMNATPDIFVSKGISQQTIYQFYNEDINIEAFNENFKQKAKNEEPKKYVLIIDEINRGNVSSIFGELITLIENDKRKGVLKLNKEVLEVELPYSRDKFSVPDNLYIIGTMNTADRSVESLDTALRRRFSFVEMQPDINILANEHISNGIISSDVDINMVEILKTINERIELLLDKDHKIGHSFFIDVINFNDLKTTFKDKIIPLLEEYFFGDFGKIGLVLGGEFIKQKANKAKFATNFIYQDESDVSNFSDKLVYEFTSYHDWNSKTFTSIYE